MIREVPGSKMQEFWDKGVKIDIILILNEIHKRRETLGVKPKIGVVAIT